MAVATGTTGMTTALGVLACPDPVAAGILRAITGVMPARVAVAWSDAAATGGVDPATAAVAAGTP